MEENLQKELAVLKKSMAAEQQRLENHKKSRRGLLEELQREQKDGATISNISLYRRFIDQVSQHIAGQEETVSLVQEQVERKRQDLVEATKRKKALKKLKHKALLAYEKVLKKREQDFLNEVGINRFNRGT